MGALVTLSTRDIQVVPGGEAACTVTVKNTGSVVDQFTVDVLGDSAPWALAEPATISLFPAADGTTLVRFRPPRDASSAAGALPFGVRVRSQEDPAGSAVEEGTVTVAAFSDTFAELVPRTSRGSRSATHELAVDNRGNARLNATVEASDADRLLAFDVNPPGVVAEPGTAAFAKIRVKPRQRFWRGQPKTRPFKVAIETEAGPPLVLDGSLLQEAVLPRRLVPALLALLGSIILLAILWLTLLQPAIKTAATQALEDAGITPAPSGAVATPGGGGGATPTPAGPTPAGPTPTPTGPPTPAPPPVPAGVPRDGRLATDGTYPNSQPFDATYYLTDLVFANQNGRAGTLELRRQSFVLITLRLENFRDLDFHYVTPIVVQKGETLTLEVKCTGPNASPCDPSVYFSGFTRP